VMEVTLNDGSVQKADMPYAPGSYQNPATDQQVQTKFLDLAEEILGQAGARRAMDVILAIDTKRDLKELISSLTPASGRKA